MIDKSDEVFDRVMTYVISQNPELTEENFGSDEVDAPPVFPFISIVQAEVKTYADGQDDRLRENMAELMFRVQIYSNSTTGKREQCRMLSHDVDDYMMRMNFSRETLGFVTNMSNNSIARLVGTYSVLADDNNFYRR
jgi:hypothetical protein